MDKTHIDSAIDAVLAAAEAAATDAGDLADAVTASEAEDGALSLAAEEANKSLGRFEEALSSYRRVKAKQTWSMFDFVDARPGRPDALPHGGTKTWRRRDVDRLLGFAIHHTAGGDDPRKTAAYHLGANHTSSDGMPGLAYTFFIRKDGAIWWAWDLDMATWSQGGGTVPDADGDGDVDRADGLGRANAHYLAIVLGGSFRSRWNRNGGTPTFRQLLAMQVLIGHLTGRCSADDIPRELFGALSHLSTGDVWPHSAFGKAACPGEGVETLIGLMQKTYCANGSVWSDGEWQRALVKLGYDLGGWGFNEDGVDGQWGEDSKEALVKFQRDRGLPLTAHRDRATEAALFGRP